MASYEWPPTGGGSGTVTSLSVVTANGFAGTVATATTTPAITLTTTVIGILQGNGTAISAATTGNLTDAGTDGITIGNGSGAVLGSGTTISQHVADTTHNGYLSSTDWTTFNSKQPAGVYVTAVSVVSTNGFTGSSSGGATPALTLTTSITGILQGNGTAISAATTTGSGSVVLATAPTLSNPVVGTQSQFDGSTKAASTGYVDTAVANAVAGINPAVAVQAATTAAGDTSGFTYNNGASGIGATFTGTTNTAVTIDGFTFTAVGQRLLVKNDTQSPSGAFNGVYSVTQIQTGVLPPVLTRALDYDAPSDMNNTGAIPVINGTVNGTTQWVLTSQVVTVGTTPLTFVKFSSNPATIGTVTSVTFTGDGTVLSSTPSSAVTTTGTVTAALKTQTASTALMGPAYGASAANPTFRAAVLNDLSTVVQSKSATYSVLATDDQIVMSGASWTATLPAANAVPAGKVFTFIHNDSSLARQYTIQRAGSDTFIGGGTSTTVATQGEMLQLRSDGTSLWYFNTRTIPGGWTSYTPTFGSGWGTNTSVKFLWRRVGSMCEVMGSATTGTVAAGSMSFTLPTNLTADTNVVNTSGQIVGQGTFNRATTAGAANYGPICIIGGDGTTCAYTNVGDGSSTKNFSGILGNNDMTSTTAWSAYVRVPIAGWN